MYANGYQVKAHARQDSLYVQDQWTVDRFTLQGALRYDHPWSYFPATTIPASRFFPGASFDEGRRRDRLQRHHAALRRGL